MRPFEKSRSILSGLRAKPAPAPARRVPMLIEELEARILHSADIGPALLHDVSVAPQAETRVLDAGGEIAAPAVQTQQTQSTELVIVDTRTPDYQQLVDDIRSEAAEGRQIEVVLLDNQSNGIDQITSILSSRKDISAVHLISHGSAGEVQLGDGVLDLQSLREHAGEIAGWANALTPDADLLIYGCDVAASPDGRTLVDALSRLTGADVAASENLTGNAAAGGDWNLEYTTGRIDTAVAIDAQTQQTWTGVLANSSPVLSGGNNLTTIAEDPAANPGTQVSALIAGHVTDADAGALTGIAVTAVDNTNGSWQYSIDAGSTWNNLGNPSDTSARLLRSNDFVRFVPNTDFNGTVNNGLTFRAWDQTSGTAGATADATSTTSTLLDHFNSVSYSNNDGTVSWSGAWVDDDGNPSAGAVKISGGQLQLQTLLGGGFINRQADLTGASSATLSFAYNNQILLSLGGNVSLQISNNGGSSYTTLATFSSGSNTGSGTFSTDISAFIAADTQVQLVSNGLSLVQSLFIDDLQISYVTPLASGVTAFSAATAASSIAITAVNDPPAGAANTVTTGEDSAYVFNVVDFGFSDTRDTPANNFLAVRITTLPGAGSLTLSGVAITAGQSVLASDITAGNLAFSPAANGNGAGYANFTFQVQDDGGGADLDPTARTMTIDVTAVNDPPAGTSNTVTATEDGSHVFGAADFGFTDPADTPANNLLAVKITTLPGAGSLTLNGVAVTTGQFVVTSDIVAGNLVFSPSANANGTGYASFTFQVQDDGGGADLDPTARTMTIDVTAVNDPPVGANNTVATVEDSTYTFVTADFGFTDPGDTPANNLLAVKIATLPGAGSLTLNGVAVTTGQFISTADVVAGNLKFAPAANGNGAGYANFTFQVQDDGGGTDLDVIARTMTIDVTAVNDPPTGTSNTVTATEDGSHVFTTTDFGFTDSADTPANNLLAVKIATLPSAGSLTLNGIAVTTGQFIASSDIVAGNLVFSPAANANGTGYASFTFQVQDDGGGADLDPTARAMTIDVTAVNDPPVGANNTVSTSEDSAYTFVTADFGFSDPVDTPANNLLAVKITTLPGAGSLTLSGVAITAGQFVSSANIAAGNLQFTPAADANGSGYASFTFQVQDDGSGTDLDVTARTMTVDVTAVNDAPVLAANAGIALNEGASAIITSASLHVTDVDNTAAQLVFSVTTTPANGHLELTSAAGVPITSFTEDDIDNNRLVYVHDGSQTTSDNFSFGVSDGAGGNIGTTAFAISVNAVDNAPVNSVPGTQATSQDTALVFSTAGGNAISISDADAGSSAVQLTLSATNGTVTLSTISGLVFAIGTGTGDSTMQFSGSVAAINTALNAMSFTPGTGFKGAAALSIVSDDLGNTGSGGPLTASSTVNVNVAATPAPPGTSPVIPIIVALPGPIPIPPTSVAAPVAPLPSIPVPTTIPVAPVIEEVPGAGGSIEPNAAAVTPVDAATGSGRSTPFTETAPASRNGRLLGVSYTLPAAQWLMFGDEPVADMIDSSGSSSGFGSGTADGRSALQSPALIDALDRLREDLQDQSRTDALVVATTAAASLGLSVGYVLWLLRGGVLISSMLSSLPAWRMVDPLPILGRLDDDDEEADDDSIESLVAANNVVPMARLAVPVGPVDTKSLRG